MDIEVDNDGQRQDENKQKITYVFIENDVQVHICESHIIPFLVLRGHIINVNYCHITQIIAELKKARHIVNTRCACHYKNFQLNVVLRPEPGRVHGATHCDVSIACDNHYHPVSTHVGDVS